MACCLRPFSTGSEASPSPISVQFRKIVRFLDGDPRPLPGALGGQIRQLRQSHGWSMRELAEKLRVDPSTVEKWERLGFNPHPQLYARLTRVLRISEPGPGAPIGQRLRARRLAKGLTQAELGRLLGVCQDLILRWELGQVVPAAGALLPISKLLGQSTK